MKDLPWDEITFQQPFPNAGVYWPGHVEGHQGRFILEGQAQAGAEAAREMVDKYDEEMRDMNGRDHGEFRVFEFHDIVKNLKIFLGEK